jgi:hypothetical protein
LKKHCKPDGIVRRLSLTGSEDEEIVEQLDLSQARSIGAFGDIKQLPSLGKSKSLRVLDLQGCNKLQNHHIKDIERLYQLRYLDISFTGITELPRQIGELLYLETLVTWLKLHGFREKPKSDAGDFDFGIQYLSSLGCLTVSLFCIDSTAAEVKAAEDAFKSMAKANPNRPTLMMKRTYPDRVLQDEQIDMAGSGTINKIISTTFVPVSSRAEDVHTYASLFFRHSISGTTQEKEESA